jgi:hypothetical protein
VSKLPKTVKIALDQLVCFVNFEPKKRRRVAHRFPKVAQKKNTTKKILLIGFLFSSEDAPKETRDRSLTTILVLARL